MTAPADPQARRAVVIGATGHLGSAISRRLLERGWRVTAASRRPAGSVNLEGLDLELAPGDAHQPDQLRRWARGRQLVVDAAAPFPLEAFRDAGIVERAAARTEALVAAVTEAGARLAVVGSFTTAVTPSGGWGGLAARLGRTFHPYFAVKDRIAEILADARRDGLSVVEVRPTLCLGPGDVRPREQCFIPRLLAGEIPAALDHLINVVDVRDVACALVSAVESEVHEPFLVAGHNLTLGDLYRWIGDLGDGAGSPRWRVPAELALGPALLGDGLSRLAGSPGPWPSVVVMLLAQHRWLDPGPRQRALGAHPRALSATLADAIAWYRRLGYC